MTAIGVAAMLEQFHPVDLLEWCAQVRHTGFSDRARVGRRPQVLPCPLDLEELPAGEEAT